VTSSRIKRNIDFERDDLARNVQQLEHRVKATMDWRTRFQKNPMTIIGLAFGGGLLLSGLIGGHRQTRPGRQRWDRESTGDLDFGGASVQEGEPSRGTTYQKHKALEMWDNIKRAVIGVAASRFRSFLNDTIPGFSEQYRKTESEKNTPSPSIH
jgi:hypothetical protein